MVSGPLMAVCMPCQNASKAWPRPEGRSFNMVKLCNAFTRFKTRSRVSLYQVAKHWKRTQWCSMAMCQPCTRACWVQQLPNPHRVVTVNVRCRPSLGLSTPKHRVLHWTVTMCSFNPITNQNSSRFLSDKNCRVHPRFMFVHKTVEQVRPCKTLNACCAWSMHQR